MVKCLLTQKTLVLTYFSSISPILGAKKLFLKNRTVMYNFIRVYGTMPKSEKSNDPVLKKYPDRSQEGGMDRPCFTGSFQLPPGV